MLLLSHLLNSFAHIIIGVHFCAEILISVSVLSSLLTVSLFMPVRVLGCQNL